MDFRPEGCIFDTALNQHYISSAEGLAEACQNGAIVEARAAVCNSSHDLVIELPCGKGIIPRIEGALGIAEGKTRDIALISRVNKIVCFKVMEVRTDSNGDISAILSRRSAQRQCLDEYISELHSGDIIEAKVTHHEHFGSFVDIGCGIPSLIPIDAISVSRISHPSDRFSIGQMIKAVVRSNENGRIFLTHKELLGSWDENSAEFRTGETVSGIVRSVEDYGIFVELAPNLAGLAEPKDGVRAGQRVSAYIKAVIPEKMKVKLVIVDTCGECDQPEPFRYFIDSGHIDRWKYSSDRSSRNTGTIFA